MISPTGADTEGPSPSERISPHISRFRRKFLRSHLQRIHTTCVTRCVSVGSDGLNCDVSENKHDLERLRDLNTQTLFAPAGSAQNFWLFLCGVNLHVHGRAQRSRVVDSRQQQSGRVCMFLSLSGSENTLKLLHINPPSCSDQNNARHGKAVHLPLVPVAKAPCPGCQCPSPSC